MQRPSAESAGPWKVSAIQPIGNVLDAVDVGLVSVDDTRNIAHVNRSAAALLDIGEGVTTAHEFAVVIRQLARNALNQADVAQQLRVLEHDPSATVRTTWEFSETPTHLGVVCKPPPFPGFPGRMWAFYDNSALARAMQASSHAAALLRTQTDASLDPQVLLEGIWEDGRVVDLIYRDVNKATREYLDVSRDDLVGHSILHSLPDIAESGLFGHYANCAQTGEPVILDDFPYENEVLGSLRYYDIRAAQSRPGWISLTWRDVTERSAWAHQVAESEERFRLLAENVADVVVRLRQDGTVTWVSDNVEDALGAPAEHWVGRSMIDFVLPLERESATARWESTIQGSTEIGRGRLIGVDGTQHWIHLHAKPFYDSRRHPDGVVASFRVIDDEVAAEERVNEQIAARDAQNRSLSRILQSNSDRMQAELQSAARYVASILPEYLGGRVEVTSRCVPSRELGGDSFDYRWIDDDHLVVYLIDVSGHGVEPALVSVSIHNALRSGTIDTDTLLQPDRTLARLNRTFPMDHQGGNYFTIWYGVYQASTRTLRYAGGGHPPALVIAADGFVVDRLSSDDLPVGILDSTEFGSHCYAVPPRCDILIYSDGAFELTLTDGTAWSLADFIDLCASTAGAPEWTLDGIIEQLQARSESGFFEDDCTLVRLNIP